MNVRACSSLVWALTLCGCADATDAAASRCGAHNSPFDAADVGHGLVVQVVLGPSTPTQPGTRFCVRAESASGAAFEQLTDGTGTAHLPVDPAAGPWDVTAARPGYQAVSVLDVTGPLDGALYSEPTRRAPSSPAHTLTVSIAGVAPNTAGVGVYDGTTPFLLYSAANGYEHKLPFDYRADAPPFQLLAIVPSVGVFSLPSVPRVDRDLQVELPQPPAPLPATTSLSIPVMLPTGWLVPPQTGGSLPQSSVGRGCGPGGACTMPTGTAEITANATPGGLTWHLEAYTGALAPEAAVANVTFDQGGVPSSGWLWLSIRVFDHAVPIDVGDVRTTSVTGQSIVDLAMTTDADGYDHAEMIVSTLERTDRIDPPPGSLEAWRAFTYRGASTHERHLPHLPAGLTFEDLGGRGTIVDTGARVLRRIDAATAPWSAREPTRQASVGVELRP